MSIPKNQPRPRPLCTLELRTDGSVAVALPDFTVIKLSPQDCATIQGILQPYLKPAELAAFIDTFQHMLPMEKTR